VRQEQDGVRRCEGRRVQDAFATEARDQSCGSRAWSPACAAHGALRARILELWQHCTADELSPGAPAIPMLTASCVRSFVADDRRAKRGAAAMRAAVCASTCTSRPGRRPAQLELREGHYGQRSCRGRVGAAPHPNTSRRCSADNGWSCDASATARPIV
jgi:hypothetical protein